MRTTTNAWVTGCAVSFGLAAVSAAESPPVPPDILSLHQRMNDGGYDGGITHPEKS